MALGKDWCQFIGDYVHYLKIFSGIPLTLEALNNPLKILDF